MSSASQIAEARTAPTRAERLLRGREAVGGEVVSGGGTGTWDLNDLTTEIQAGSYLLMDTAYGGLGLPFRPPLSVLATVISNSRDGCRVRRRPESPRAWTTATQHRAGPSCGSAPTSTSPSRCATTHRSPRSGARGTGSTPAHVDPTVAYHERHVHRRGTDDEVIDEWPVDLRGW